MALAQETSLDEVTVTGTRIRRDDYQSTTATQTITSEDMEKLGLVSAADMLAQMPSNVGLYSIDTTGEGAFFVGASLANLRGMNTAFGTRTLTLVDGRRFVSTTNGGGVDLSFIPSILIGRMETVTGGASATYGSDATMGVVNVVLDRNVRGLRLDASYGENTDGYFGQYSVAVASGLEVLKGRGDVTVSAERQVSDPVASCGEVLDWCARSMSRIQTHRTGGANLGCGVGQPINPCPLLYPIPESAKFFPDQNFSSFEVFEGARYLHTGNPYGVVTTNNKQPWSASNGTFYQFTPDGTDIVEWQSEEDGLTGFWRDFAYSDNPLAANTNERTRNATVFAGEGQLQTFDNVLRNGQVRENIFTRFNWDVTEDIRLNAEVSYGKTNGETFQNRATTHQQTVCIALPQRDTATGAVTGQDFSSVTGGATREWGGPNAFWSTLSPEAQQLLLDRNRNDANSANINCAPGAGAIYGTQWAPTRNGAQILKNWGDQIDRGIKTETEVERISVGANGPLLGDNWTWDANLQIAGSDRWQQLYNNISNYRMMFALDSVIDPNTGQAVCRINSTGPEGETLRQAYTARFMNEPWTLNPATNPQLAAAYATQRARVDALRNGCVPLNPFGLTADPAAMAYAWDDLTEFTYSDQAVASITVSGEFWKGFGAGPFRMAAGIDYRDETTENAVGGDPNQWVRSDFAAQYGDPWTGGTKAMEAFAEFDLPLVSDRMLADSISMSFTGRRILNNSFRDAYVDSNGQNVASVDVTRYGTSWRSSLLWSPIDSLRVRATKSYDVRMPALRELFYQQTFVSFNQGGTNPWRTLDTGGDQWTWIIGANPNLRDEASTTDTFGVVFTPTNWARGLQLALDYSELTVSGGISYATGSDPDNEDNLHYTVYRCFEYDDPSYCPLIQFNPNGSPEEPVDPNNPVNCVVGTPCAARTDITGVVNTQENTEDYWIRGLDISGSYRLSLNGGGSIALRMLATKALEQNRCTSTVRDSATGLTSCLARQNFVGITGGGGGGSVFANYTSQPEWAGNIYTSYSRNAFTITGQARYTGAGVVSLTDIGPDDPRWAPGLLNTSSINKLPSWTTWNLTVGYDFTQSRFAPERAENLQLTLTIDNLFDKQPDFWSGGGTGGVNRRFFASNGRTFRLNLRSAF